LIDSQPFGHRLPGLHLPLVHQCCCFFNCCSIRRGI
jgi:hypothetical protein